MSKMIEELILNLKELNRLGHLASTKLSEEGEQDKKDGDLLMYQAFWNKVIEQSEDRTNKIIQLSKDFPENKIEMSHPLGFYRSLPFYIAECSPTWSAYYQDIRQRMKKIHCLLIDIDTKYHLGQHADD